MVGLMLIPPFRRIDSLVEKRGPILNIQPLEKATSELGIAHNKPKECYKCGGKGHFAVVYITLDQKLVLTCENQNTAIEGHQEIDSKEGVEEVFVEEVFESSKLPLCVIRQVLTGMQKESNNSDSWLCNNIFHMRVEHQGKALNLIIDDGNVMNVIAKEVVDKLWLHVEKHPNLYKLNWVDDTTLQVNIST